MKVSTKPRILLVEDEEPIRTGLTDVFLFNGYEVDAAADGPTGLEKALAGGHHLVILDVMLPEWTVSASATRFEKWIAVCPSSCSLPGPPKKTSSGDSDWGRRYVAKPFSVRQLLGARGGGFAQVGQVSP